MATTAYRTTHHTIVETTREPAAKPTRQRRPIGESFYDPAKARVARERKAAEAAAEAATVREVGLDIDDNPVASESPEVRTSNPLLAVAMPVDHTEYHEFDEDNGMVLIVARVLPRMAGVMRLAFDAF